MAKKRFQRSDIPYADRLLMERHQKIADHRNEAARIAMMVACVSLNDTEGLGYMRLSRFAKHFHEQIQEYYSDPEVGEAHLKTRLEQMGFMVVDGKMYAVQDENGNVVPKDRLFGGAENDYGKDM